MTARMLSLTAVLVVAFAAPASAAEFVVTAQHDEGNGVCTDVPADCTLRDAITQAGASDIVRLPSGVYELTEGELVLAGDTVAGSSARTTVVDGLGDSRVFYAASGSNVISGVTVTGGDGQGAQLGRAGGAILVRFANLTIAEITVRDNSAGQGGGIANFGGTLTILRSTIRDNDAAMATSGAQGGGIFSGGTTYLRNSTVSGNTSVNGEAPSEAGGIFLAGGTFVSESSTIANNQANFGSAIAGHPQAATSTTLTHTIVADNSGFACANAPFQGSPNVVDDTTCGTTATDPSLGPLMDNGGATDTHAIPANSPARDSGETCEPGDQRGIARLDGCDIGAFEFGANEAPPLLWVITEVVNDSGGALTPSQVSVHVTAGGVEDDESPQPGDPSGRRYAVAADVTHTVTAPASGYTTTIAGHCTPAGTVVMQNREVRVCTVRLGDVGGSQPPQGGGGGGGQQPPPAPQPLPPPVAGESVNVQPSGTVKVKRPGSKQFVELTEDAQLPVGTIVDALKGRVTLTASGGQTATFYGGVFKIGQGKGAKPLTTLTLVEKLSCSSKAGKAVAAAKGKKKRRLWGDGSGKFRTKGQHSAATVVGTKWLVEDRCTSTLTRVTQGRVSVRDFIKKQTVIVRAGKKYVARARR